MAWAAPFQGVPWDNSTGWTGWNMLKPPAVRFVCLRPWIRCNHLLPKCRALDLAFYLFFWGRVIFAKHGFVHGKLFEQTDTAPGKGNETKTLQILVDVRHHPQKFTCHQHPLHRLLVLDVSFIELPSVAGAWQAHYFTLIGGNHLKSIGVGCVQVFLGMSVCQSYNDPPIVISLGKSLVSLFWCVLAAFYDWVWTQEIIVRTQFWFGNVFLGLCFEVLH